jgi:hypothetical protein
MYEIVEKLEKIIDLAEDGHLPRSAGRWAEGALETAESIISSIDDRDDGGTDGQLSALENIEEAADKWL